jgi:glucuronate isomerase
MYLTVGNQVHAPDRHTPGGGEQEVRSYAREALVTTADTYTLSPDRLFSPEPAQRGLARELYDMVKGLPIVSPHGHVDPNLLADPDASFGTPAELFILPDHYVFRMLYSRGIRLEDLGIPTREGTVVQTDHRKVWQLFAEHFYLFRGTPTGLWLADELQSVFGIHEKLSGESAQRIYDELEEKLARPEYRPRALYERFNIEVLCTTDAATATLEQHKRLREEGWGNVRPTFRPDAVVNLDTPGWRSNIDRLSELSGVDIVDYDSYIRALEIRRAYFKALGAVASDHSALSPHAERMYANREVEILDTALSGGDVDEIDVFAFTCHMLMEMARMSSEDGLVMQLHIGSYRNHNQPLFWRFGPDMGADIPSPASWTESLQPLLNEYGNDPRFHLIAFTLDENMYARELAPLAGHYPSLLLGPPWWFLDSPMGIRRYLDRVVETAGIQNLAGFNDDTRAFASIPARHDVWRRVTCDWLAGQVVRGVVDEEDAVEMALDLAYRLAKRAYRLGEAQ